jgi:hypothetical protein
MPVVLVVGPPRSGTTVTIQWLAATGLFATPSNLMARLPEAPYLAGLLQRLLTDPELDYRGELSVGDIDHFASVAGKTAGLLAPHEYFYFWRRFFPLDVARPMTAAERSRSDPEGLAHGLASLQTGVGAPIVLKAIIAQYDLDVVLRHLPSAIVLVTRRREAENVESLLETRTRVMGAESEWFSVRPKGSDLVADADPVVQAAAQVAWTNDDLDAQLADIDSGRVVRVDHADFCSDPASTFGSIQRACEFVGHPIGAYSGPERLKEHRRRSRRESDIEQALKDVRTFDRVQETS